MNSYRPVSNISFMSKILEKCACQQLLHHLLINNLYSEHQSAYRANHSCETALVKIADDIFKAVDQNTSVLVVLLDFSSAFDTIDHELLLHKLYTFFGIRDNALQWFRSYLKDRKFFVKIGDVFSKGGDLDCGVPQGSILGPVLFTLYSQDIKGVIENHGLNYHMFADDVQLYLPYSGNTSNLSALQSCLKDIIQWSKQNSLKLNDAKTKFLNISMKNCKHTVNQITLFGTTFVAELNAKNLGFVLDPKLSCRTKLTRFVRSVILCWEIFGEFHPS